MDHEAEYKRTCECRRHFRNERHVPLADELRLEPGALDNSWSHYLNRNHRAPVGCCTLSENGLIQDVNLATATLFGEIREGLTQQPFSRFVSKRTRVFMAAMTFCRPPTDRMQ